MSKEELLEAFRKLASELQTSHQCTPEQLFRELTKEEHLPATIFSTTLNPLQALVSYLHNNKGHNIPQIAKEINRSYRATWGAKTALTLKPTKTNYFLPLTIFDEHKSIMEAVIMHLKDHYSLRFSDIATLLNKDPRTVWTTYKRAQEKNAQNS